MSATIITEPMIVPTQQDPTPSVAAATAAATSVASQIEIEFAKCECCGLTEECTPAYIERIRERYMGKWVCGLCSEAVTDEMARSVRLISSEEAFNRHLDICRNFRSSNPPAGSAALIAAVSHLLRRSLDCPRGGLRSTPASPTHETGERRRGALARSESCFPELSG